MQGSNCPICNEPIEAGQGECPRCGFKLIGKTEAFEPVLAGDSPSPARSAAGTPALQIVSGPYTGETFPLGEGEVSLGRDPKCDVFLSNMTVSRHHATIHIDGEKARIVDEGSLNGTWVDGQVVDEAPLAAGTHVQIGTFDMVFLYV